MYKRQVLTAGLESNLELRGGDTAKEEAHGITAVLGLLVHNLVINDKLAWSETRAGKVVLSRLLGSEGAFKRDVLVEESEATEG